MIIAADDDDDDDDGSDHSYHPHLRQQWLRNHLLRGLAAEKTWTGGVG